ncbi:MAG: hypothetical protein F2881_00780 [Actinobacteria bacterium]|uniref:Unannotated protein n=1 Tax=freshwater metagenome TaxID=449393 RepID=A0A6J7NQ94_9ZZZZ|nr:hypothetical protein [Actinomycetota bacterium]
MNHYLAGGLAAVADHPQVTFARTAGGVTVRLRVALSSRAHHITLTKQEDGVYYQGGITIR